MGTKDFDFDAHWRDLNALSLIKVKIGLCQIHFTPRDYILRTMNV